MLTNLKQLMVKREGVEKEVQEQQAAMNTREMKEKMRECQEAEEQLANIEARLG